jgi:hypothetical protein
MKRWDANQMLDIGKKLFAKIHKRKYHTHHNNEVHYMAREIDEWLVTLRQPCATSLIKFA